MQKEPPPFVWAVPDEKNILTCAYRCPCRRASFTDQSLVGNFLIVRDLCRLALLIVLTSRDSSAVLRTLHLQAESTMAFYYSLQNTPSSLLASRYAYLSLLTSDDGSVARDSQMLTPSGRFQPDKKICFSMSDFHPGTVSSMLSCSVLL
jgi:hypothetical protein